MQPTGESKEALGAAAPPPDQAALRERYDVVILGGGLAGLTLARHLLLASDKTILLLERRDSLPPARQKVGESTVQLAGYYYSKVLEMEEHLFSEQVIKYNLRFYWKSGGRDNSNFEDYSQAYIRQLSNIVSHQLDRNTFEAELLRRNLQSERFHLRTAVTGLDVALAAAGDPSAHGVRFEHGGAAHAALAEWVVDATGRGKVLARRKRLERQNPIRHGTTFFWVDGLVDIDKLTDRSPREVRLKPERRQLGHVPFWLATNHFCGEGFWFWVIPLQGKTSFGLVYDRASVPREQVANPAKLIEWVCREFPLFARDLPLRKVVDWSGLKDYSFDCAQTISSERWALTGEAGRFTDPLYSPGSDLISCYNTMIVDAILTREPARLAAKCRLYEGLMRALYGAYVPSYAASYDVLGDSEAFYLKYVWELSVYFGFYVFPFINDLFTDVEFVPRFLARFAKLGRLNSELQSFLSAFYQWKKVTLEPPAAPRFDDFTDLPALQRAERTFYKVGLTGDEACAVLDEQLQNLLELARFIVAHVAAAVLDAPEVLTDAAFVGGLDLAAIRFDPEAMRRHLDACTAAGAAPGDAAPWTWSFDALQFQRFRTPRRPAAEAAAVETAGAAGADAPGRARTGEAVAAVTAG